MTIRVLIADDHPLLLRGLAEVLHQCAQIELVAQANNGEEALEKILNIRPDIAVLDVEMPKMSGLEVASRLRKTASKTKIVILTLVKDGAVFREALNHGVQGYVLKDNAPVEVLDCIRSIHEGGSYISPVMSHFLLNGHMQEDSPLVDLTKQERNVLKLVAQNKTTREIAEMLFISAKTVENHRSKIAKKLQLSGKQGSLLRWALENKSSILK